MKKHPIFYIIKKEFLELKRSELLRILIVAPIVQMIIFGYVATTDIKNVKTVICDEDRTLVSRELAAKFINSEYFSVVKETPDQNEIDTQFAKGKAMIAVRIPKGLSEKVKKGLPGKVQVIIDGSDSNTATVSMNRAVMIIQGYSEQLFRLKIDLIKKTTGGLPAITLKERVWYNPELKSANVMVPGVIGLILMIVTMIVTAVSIVREKENGNIEQIVVTPVKPAEIILGKIVPYILIALINIVLITALSLLIFGISFKGNFFTLLAISMFMIVANLGLGIYVSTVSSTQQQAMLTSMFFIVPNMLLSGFLFPIKNMPEILQAITYLIPLRYYMVIIRGVFLKGLGFTELIPETAALLVFAVAIFTLAIKQFRKTSG